MYQKGIRFEDYTSEALDKMYRYFEIEEKNGKTIYKTKEKKETQMST